MNPSAQESESPQLRQLRGVHDAYAASLASSLSAFLQAEIKVTLERIWFACVSDFKREATAPACLISFQLHPQPDWAVFSLDGACVFGLLELLLGGASAPRPSENRNLTEIEWSLLEEVVRTMVAPLGEAWKVFHAVEFKVQALESDPAQLALPEGATRIARLKFRIQLGESAGEFAIALPQIFFDPLRGAEPATIGPPLADVQRNFALLQDANVDVEVLLDGATMMFEELATLVPGHVVQFAYPLEKPLRAVVNGVLSTPCRVVALGNKRAFQVEEVI